MLIKATAHTWRNGDQKAIRLETGEAFIYAYGYVGGGNERVVPVKNRGQYHQDYWDIIQSMEKVSTDRSSGTLPWWGGDSSARYEGELNEQQIEILRQSVI